MKKILLFIATLLATAAHAQILTTTTDQKTLRDFNCQQTGFSFINQRLVFDEITDAKKHLYLIKNISTQQTYIDFPEGHVGASAGLTQTIDANAWLGYVSVPGKNKIHTENKRGRQIYKHPSWACATIDGPNRDCEKLLYVCEVQNTQSTLAKNILQKSEQGNWSAQTEISVMQLLKNWFS